MVVSSLAAARRRAVLAYRARVDTVRSLAVETVYPRRCAGCRALLPPFAPPWCDGCGIPPDRGACRCDQLSPAITGARAAAPFAGWMESAIHDFKYRDERARADHLGEELAGVLSRIDAVDGLVPVPLHPSRERRRGYNHSALLTTRVGALTGIPTVGVLHRVRRTEHQVGLGAPDRRRNVAGAFALLPGATVGGARLVLVDDVMTTGSTVGACAEALRAAEAADVWVATLAREM